MGNDRAVFVVVVLGACFHARPPDVLTAPWSADRLAEDGATVAAPASWDMDESAAIAFALAHSPMAADRRDQEAVAEARIGAAKQLTNPELHLGQTTEEDLLVGEQTRFVVAFRVFPDNPWLVDARIAQARAGHDAERAVTTTAVRALAAQISQLYAQLAFGEATRAILVQERAVLDERRRVLAEQLVHSTAIRLEVILAEQDAMANQTTISAIDLASERQRAQLARLIGIPPGQIWKPVLDLAAEQRVRTGLDRAALEARALARPELAELAARARAADASAYQEKTKRLPWIDSLQVERSVRDNTEWAASASITLPLFSLNAGRIAAAEAERHHHAARRERLATDTIRQVDDAVALVEATGKRAHELAALIGPTSAELATLFAAEKAAAVSDPVKLLLLEERNVRAQRATLDAAYDHRLAVIALEALVGGAL